MSEPARGFGEVAWRMGAHVDPLPTRFGGEGAGMRMSGAGAGAGAGSVRGGDSCGANLGRSWHQQSAGCSQPYLVRRSHALRSARSRGPPAAARIGQFPPVCAKNENRLFLF